MFRRITDHAARTRSQVRLQGLARFLDNAVAIPGTSQRFGADALIGAVPVVGDLVTTGMGLYIVYEGYRLGASRGTIAKMLGNVALDWAIGQVPGLGDVADLFFRANVRNLALLGIHSGRPPAGTPFQDSPPPHTHAEHAGHDPGVHRKRVMNTAREADAPRADAAQ